MKLDSSDLFGIAGTACIVAAFACLQSPMADFTVIVAVAGGILIEKADVRSRIERRNRTIRLAKTTDDDPPSHLTIVDG